QELADKFGELLAKFGKMGIKDVAMEMLIYRYLITSTRIQQIDQALSIGNETAMAHELRGDRRYYQIDGIPEHLMRIFLLLEHSTGSMMWKEQVEQLHKLLTNHNRRQVYQQPTGSGKTARNTPVKNAYASKNGCAVYNFLLDSVASTQIREICDKTATAFGREGAHFTVSRLETPTTQQLDAWLVVLKRAIANGETLNGVKLDMQTLELLMVEEVTNRDIDSAKLARYIEILRLVKLHVIANIDEAHLLLRRTQELNHPLDRPVQIDEQEKVIVLECASVLAGHMDKNYLEMRHLLIEHFLKLFDVPKNQRNGVGNYLQDMQIDPPQFVINSHNRSLIALARGMICRIIPEVTPQLVGGDERRPIPNVDYGRSLSHADKEFAKPYQGNNNPMEDSRIKNVYEAALKTAFLYLKNGLDMKQVNKLHCKLREFAKQDMDANGTSLKQTSVARHLARWTGNDSAIESKILSIDEMEHMRRDPGAILSYIHHFIEIESYAKSVRSTAQNFASMFKGVYGMTASPDLPGTFPTGTEVLWFPGTAGEFVNFICTTCNSVRQIEPNTPKTLLNEILNTYGKDDKQMRSIIDGGAFFEGMSNETVARQIATFVEANGRDDVRGIVYFEGEKAMILEVGQQHPIALESSQVRVSNRFVYFDDAHTTGADLKQEDDVRAIVTVGPKTNLQQAVGRLRRRSHGQRVTLLKLKGTLGRSIEPRDLIELLEKKSYEASRKENFLSAFDQIANLRRREVLNSILMAKNVDEAKKIGEKNRELLLQVGRPDPFDLYGEAQKMVPFTEALAEEKKKV
ncbi:MAG: hypothetical protein P0S94_04385, partial [Simkaniaceae bacterium]|nr:hypothetical protein [Simkaniaceae bacterium]